MHSRFNQNHGVNCYYHLDGSVCSCKYFHALSVVCLNPNYPILNVGIISNMVYINAAL